MAEIKINDLTAYTSPVSTDVLPIVDVGNDVTKKVSIADLVALAAVTSVNTQTGAVVLDADDISDSSTTNKFATATQLTDIGTAVQPGDNVSTLTNDAGYITATGTYWTEGTNQLYPSDAGNDVLIGGTLPSSPNIKLAADGSAVFAGGDVNIDSSGNVGIGTTSPTNTLHLAGGNGVGVRVENTVNSITAYSTLESTGALQTNISGTGFFSWVTGGSEKVQIDSSGRLLVGTSTARSNFDSTWGSFTPSAQFETNNNTLNGLSVVKNSTSGYPAEFSLAATKDSAIGGNSIVGSSQRIGQISFKGADGTNLVEAAQIRAEVDGTPGANDMPGRLVLSTTANGASSPTERLRINSSGNVLIGGTLPSAPNIELNADGSAEFESTVSSESFFESDRSFSTGACFVGKNSGSQTSKISADGSAEFAGKLVSASTVSGDIGTTLATKDYVDSVPTAPVDSVNGQTGVVVLDADNIDDTSTTHKFATAAQLTDIGTAVQPGDLATVATSGAYGDLSGTPATAVPAAGGTFTGDVEFDGDIAADGVYTGAVTAVGALAIDCSSSNYFTKTINGNSTFTFTNVPSTRAFGFTLELTHTSGTVTWPASVKFPADTAPTLTTGKTHIFVFVTDDGGTRFRGAALVDYIN